MQSDRPPIRSEQFGPLQGVRIISSGTIIAQPFAAGMAAEMGAEVIHIERPKLGDVWRSVEFAVPKESGGTIAAGWMQTQRNTYDITLDLSTLAGRRFSSSWSHKPIYGWRAPFQAHTTNGAWTTKRSTRSIHAWSLPTFPAMGKPDIPTT